ALLQQTLDPERLHRYRGRGGSRVDDANRVASLGRGPRALHRPREPAGYVDREDPLAGGELVVGGGEIGRWGRRRRGQVPGAEQPLVEGLRRQLDVVTELLGAEADAERDDTPVREPGGRVGKVGRRVEDDPGRRGRELHRLVASRIASTTASNGSSLERH